MKKRIAVLLGVLFLMGAVVAPVMAQLPNFPGEEPEVEQVEIPNYTQWPQQQKIGFDISGNGEIDISMAKYVNQEIEEAVLQETGMTIGVPMRVHTISVWEFSSTEAVLFWHIWRADKPEEPEGIFAILENGQWKTVGPQVYTEKMMELFQQSGIDPRYIFEGGLIQTIRWLMGG